nr:Uma2 family endonuclease [Longitalea luteola]
MPHYTYDDWIHWEGKWELIRGIAIAMSPAPVPKHQRISSSLSRVFGVPLRACNKCTDYQPLDYRVADDIILQPDFLIVCGEITKPYLDFPPALIVEILLPATALKDRHTKYGIYQKQGIKLHEFFFPECTARVDFKEIW